MILIEFETDTPILRETRRAVPDMTLSVVSEQAPDVSKVAGAAPIHLLFWASGDDFEALEAALEEDPTVTDPRPLANAGHRRLYRVLYSDEGTDWTAHHEWVDLDGTLIQAETIEDGWMVRMRFPDRESVAAFRSWFNRRGLPFTLTQLYTEGSSDSIDIGPNLSEKQREALLTAWHHGYFNVPRGIDLSGLGAMLGISDVAASQRIRRGVEAVLEYEFGSQPTERGGNRTRAESAISRDSPSSRR